MPQRTDEIALPRDLPSTSGGQKPASVTLVGFMGAGKTTVGRALAAQLDWRFLDLDDLIEARAARTIGAIFEQSGEAAFRALEHRILRDTVGRSGAEHLVLALGGGAFTDGRNRALLRAARIPAIFLDAPVEELLRRCRESGVTRPLLREANHFCELYQRRRAAYQRATLELETLNREIPALVEEIISRLGLARQLGAFH